jgi:hypothetical protein
MSPAARTLLCSIRRRRTADADWYCFEVLREERRPNDSRWEVEVLDATFDLELLIEMPNIGAGSGTAD